MSPDKTDMDAKGRSIDNIVIERFRRTLKYEDVKEARNYIPLCEYQF